MWSNLKPLPRLIIIFLVVGGLVAGGNFGYEYWKSHGKQLPGVTATTTPSGKVEALPKGDGPIGSNDNPLKVSLVSFHGYAPALVANGNSLTTQSGSIYGQKGVNVKFLLQDDVPTLTTLFEGNVAHCAWRTSDFWAQEQPNLRNAKYDAKAVIIVDNTQGADAIIARDANIKSIEDLAGHTVALLQFTPSHGLILDAVHNSSLSERKKQSIKYVFIQAEEGTAGVRAAFESGKVDAAVLWDPDLSLAIRNGGGHVIYSTKIASNLIYDVVVCDGRVLKSDEGRAAVQKFVAGWLDGIKAAKANPDQAVTALSATEEMFKLLADKEGRPFVQSLFKNLVWTDLSDNARILGLAGGPNHYERVYTQFDQIYRAAGALANPNSPVIAAQDSFDYSFIKDLLAQDTSAQTAAGRSQDNWNAGGMKTAAASGSAITKPVTINFQTGNAALNEASKRTINTDMVPFIEQNGRAYIEISGNADSTGSASVNQNLSQRRAQVVVDFLTKEWDLPVARFKIVGNGSTKPICNESSPDVEGVSLDECRAMNRATRVAVFKN